MRDFGRLTQLFLNCSHSRTLPISAFRPWPMHRVLPLFRFQPLPNIGLTPPLLYLSLSDLSDIATHGIVVVIAIAKLAHSPQLRIAFTQNNTFSPLFCDFYSSIAVSPRILCNFATVFRKRHKILLAQNITELPPRIIKGARYSLMGVGALCADASAGNIGCGKPW